MPTSKADFDARMALITPKHTLRGMFFSGVANAVREVAGEAASAEVLKMYGKAKHIEFLSYPLADWFPAMYRAADLLEPKLGLEGAFRRLGRQAVDDFFASGVGKTLLLVAGGRPRMLMQTSPSSYSTAVSWGDRKVEFTGEKRAIYTMKDEVAPAIFHEGVLISSLEVVGAKDIRVIGRQETLTTAVFEVSWT